MPEEVDFDARRVRPILDDLEPTTTAPYTRPMLRLEREPDAVGGVVVRGLATRMGMIRLGCGSPARRSRPTRSPCSMTRTDFPTTT